MRSSSRQVGGSTQESEGTGLTCRSLLPLDVDKGGKRRRREGDEGGRRRNRKDGGRGSMRRRRVIRCVVALSMPGLAHM